MLFHSEQQRKTLGVPSEGFSIPNYSHLSQHGYGEYFYDKPGYQFQKGESEHDITAINLYSNACGLW